MTESAWYCIKTKPQREAVAFARILEQGFDAWMPLMRIADKPLRPLFPGYLFTLVHLNQNWGPIMNTRGVARILSTPDGFPQTVPHDVIDELKSRLVDDVLPVQATSDRPNFVKGQTVRITEGAFESLDALFLTLRGEQAEIILGIAGRAAKVRIPVTSLAKPD